MNKEQRTVFTNLPQLQQSVALAKMGDPLMTDYDAYVEAKGGEENVQNRPAAEATISRMMSSPNLKWLIDSFKTETDNDRINEKIITREQMVVDLSIIATATIFDICELLHADEEMMNVDSGEMFTGVESFSVKKISDIKPEHHKLIREIKMGKYGLEVKLIDPMQARKMLVEIQGMNAPIKTETLMNAQVNVSDEELADKLRLLGIGRNHNQLGDKSNG
jgi:hypothetical protein